MDDNITGTPEERLEMPWRFDAQGKRLSGPRGVEERDEFEARTRKDIALEAENEKRWAGWNESRNLPEGRELTVLEIAAIKEAADQESLDQEEGAPAVEPEAVPIEIRAQPWIWPAIAWIGLLSAVGFAKISDPRAKALQSLHDDLVQIRNLLNE